MTGKALTIMHVIDSGGLYGAERVLLELAAASRDQGHRVIVAPIVAPQDMGDPLGDAARSRALEVRPFTIPDGLKLKEFRAVLDFARAEGVDVIHSHGYKANILLALTPRARRPCPVLATLHGWTASRALSKMGIYEWLERSLLWRLDYLVAVSPSLRDRVPALAGRRAIAVIPNGVRSTAAKRPQVPDQQLRDFLASGPAIMAAGRLSAEKGFDVLIRAMGHVAESIPTARLVIAGEGPERPRLEALIRTLSLLSHVRLPGYLADLRELMGIFQLYVLSSYREGLPTVILEAMAEGLPIVATDVGSVAVALDYGQFGRLVPPGNVPVLGRAITDMLIDHSERSRLAQAAKEHIAARYSLGQMASAYQGYYSSLAKANRITAETRI